MFKTKKLGEFTYLIKVNQEDILSLLVDDSIEVPDFIINHTNVNYFLFLLLNLDQADIQKPCSNLERYYPKNNLVSLSSIEESDLFLKSYVQKGVDGYHVVWDPPTPFKINYFYFTLENYRYEKSIKDLVNPDKLLFIIRSEITEFISKKYKLNTDSKKDFALMVDHLGNINHKEMSDDDNYLGVPHITSLNVSRFEFMLDNLRYLKDVELIDSTYRFTLKLDPVYLG